MFNTRVSTAKKYKYNIYFADYAKRDIQRDANNNKTVDRVDVR